MATLIERTWTIHSDNINRIMIRQSVDGTYDIIQDNDRIVMDDETLQLVINCLKKLAGNGDAE